MTGWAASEIARFRQLARTHSASQCSAVLSGEFGRAVSRNAVAGQAARLGVHIRGGRRGMAAPRPSALKRDAKRKRVIPPTPQAPVIPVIFLKATGCLYAVNSAEPLLFCNARIALPGEIDERVRKTSPRYCPRHALEVASKRQRP